MAIIAKYGVSRMNPLVSVYLPTHNRAHVLPRAIESVLSQDYKNWELLIIDDGSTDDTEALVKSYIDRVDNVRYFKNNTPKGACVARNVGIHNAKGVFVTGLDDDDAFTPDRLSTLVAAYSDDYSFVCSAWKMVPRTIRNTLRDILRYRSGLISLQDILDANQVGNQVLVKRDRILALGGFDESLTAWQDYDMWVRLIQAYGPAFKLAKKTQIIYEQSSIGQRISTSPKRIQGIKLFREKHGSIMNEKQLKRVEALLGEI